MLACSWLAREMAVQHSVDLPEGSHPRPKELSKRAVTIPKPIRRRGREGWSPLLAHRSKRASHRDVLVSKRSIISATAVQSPANRQPPLLRRRGRPQPHPCKTCHCGTASGKRVASFAGCVELPSPPPVSTRAPRVIITQYTTDALAHQSAR